MKRSASINFEFVRHSGASIGNVVFSLVRFVGRPVDSRLELGDHREKVYPEMAKIRSEIDWSHLLFGIIPDALWRPKGLIDGRSTIDYQFVSQKTV